MTDGEIGDTPAADGGTVEEQLLRAARDLWSMVQESGDSYVIFMDHRRLSARVELADDGLYWVTWQSEDGSWVPFERGFENPREAAFHAYQGPH